MICVMRINSSSVSNWTTKPTCKGSEFLCLTYCDQTLVLSFGSFLPQSAIETAGKVKLVKLQPLSRTVENARSKLCNLLRIDGNAQRTGRISCCHVALICCSTK